MSFLRHREIYPSDEGAVAQGRALAHRLDAFPAGYSLVRCAPAVKYQTMGSGQNGKEQDESVSGYDSVSRSGGKLNAAS
jgi:hypothetical protein